MSEPLVSIVVPAFNAEDSIGRCLGSIMIQTYSNLEVIVVDDGSTDGTSGVAEGLRQSDARLRGDPSGERRCVGCPKRRARRRPGRLGGVRGCGRPDGGACGWPSPGLGPRRLGARGPGRDVVRRCRCGRAHRRGRCAGRSAARAPSRSSTASRICTSPTDCRAHAGSSFPGSFWRRTPSHSTRG